MSVELRLTPFAIGLVIGSFAMDIAGFGDVPGALIAFSLGLLSVVAWWYSPLPNRTTTFGVMDSGAGYWGFRRNE